MRLELDSTSAAVPLADNSISSSPGTEAKEALEQGIRAAQAGDRAKARGLLLRSAELEPRNETTWLWLASISEFPEELLVFLSNVLDINPRNERALEWTAATRSLLAKTFVQRGIEAYEENRLDLASDCFNKALEHDQRNSMAWLWMASLSDSEEGKITYLEKVLEIDPENADARTALEAAKRSFNNKLLEQAKAAAISGSKADAIEFVDAIIAESPECIEAWLLRCHLVDNFEQKIYCYDRILEIDPYNAAAASGRESLNSIFGGLTPSAPAELKVGKGLSQKFDPIEYVEDTPSDKSPTQDLVLPAGFAPRVDSASVETDSQHLAAGGDEEPGMKLAPNDAFSDGEIQDEMVDYTVPESTRSVEVGVPEVGPSVFFNAGSTPEVEFQSENFSVYADIERQSTFGSADEDVYQTVKEPTPSPASATRGFHPDDLDGDIPIADEEFPDFQQTLTGFESVLVKTPDRNHDVRPSACPFCATPNESQTIVCHSCLSVLTLSDLEMLLGNQHADKFVLRETVARMESERAMRELSEEELVTLAIGHLNLRNFQFGFAYLQEASKLNPNNVVLAGQVHALLIRLEDIRKQEEAAEKMPKGKTILVVDDSPTVRKLIAGKLEKSGHEVFCSADGVEAMERLENLVPDLVLLDITMPRMDGYQVCKLIRSNPVTKDIPVVMISGKDGFFDKVRGRMAGTTGYITKPFGPETLMKAVEVYLKGETPELA